MLCSWLELTAHLPRHRRHRLCIREMQSLSEETRLLSNKISNELYINLPFSKESSRTCNHIDILYSCIASGRAYVDGNSLACHQTEENDSNSNTYRTHLETRDIILPLVLTSSFQISCHTFPSSYALAILATEVDHD